MANENQRVENIIVKITEGELFRFFDSERVTRFRLGSKKTCEICVKDLLVLPEQVMFDNRGGVWYVVDLTPFDSKSEVFYNGKRIKKPVKFDSGTLEIKKAKDKKSAAAVKITVVRKIAKRRSSEKNVSLVDLTSKTVTTIGRDASCDIVVENPQVSKQHCRIIFDGDACYVEDLKSMNGTYVNNRKVKRIKLNNYDRISISAAAYTYFERKLLYSKSGNGIEIDVVGVTKEVQDRNSKGRIRLVNNASFSIKAGDFVAIVGGSGAGKSTILDCINGLRPATGGRIYYDTNDYYDNINSYKGVIGNVPQKDIMHDDLAVEEGLLYTALIRMRTDLKREEVKRRVQGAIDDVKLTGKEKLKISSLSGGQKKRVSIAMELLSDPKIIFLDEPTSGLSPDLDLEMMGLLKELAAKGRTIVIITHAMENLDKCDKIAFFGKGGRLCYYGNYDGIFRYFNRKSYSRIFAALTDEKICRAFERKYRQTESYKKLMKKFAELYDWEEPDESEEENGKERRPKSADQPAAESVVGAQSDSDRDGNLEAGTSDVLGSEDESEESGTEDSDEISDAPYDPAFPEPPELIPEGRDFSETDEFDGEVNP